MSSAAVVIGALRVKYILRAGTLESGGVDSASVKI